MQADCAYIESAHKYRLVLFVCRIHPAPFIPRGQKSTAAHGANNFPVFFVHTGHIAFTGQTQPVWVHGFAGASDSCLKDIFTTFSFSMQLFIIEEYNFREQDWFFESFFSLSTLTHLKHNNGSHLGKTAGSSTGGYSNERIIAPAGTNSVKFIFPPLKTLTEFIFNIFHCFFFGPFLRQTQIQILLYVFRIAQFSIRLQYQINAGNGKPAVLLAGCAEYDIADYVKSYIQAFGFIVPEIPHFKAAF